MEALVQIDDGQERQKLASWMAGLGVAGITAISITVIVSSSANSLQVMTAVLPLFASWIATVLAYYFARENLRSATNSVSALLASNSTTQLSAVSVKSKMIERTRIIAISDRFTDLPKTSLKEIVAYLDHRGVSRSPVFDSTGVAVQMIHVSEINEFILQQAAVAMPINQLTYGDLIGVADLKRMFETSFGLVAESATLTEAAAKMNATPGCEDVFVTKSGGRGEPVLGWITDNVILEASK
jgi:hypothetical protein